MSTTLSTEALSSAFQVALFTLIPFIVWLITARKKESFFSWIGLKGIGKDKKECFKYTLIAFIICEVTGQIVTNTVLKADWNVSQYAGMGAKGLPCVILYAFVHTALSEEILYRGFIQKRLQSKLGFNKAVIIQAFIFGLSHVILSIGQVTVLQGIFLLLYPMIPGIATAYVNEKKADGSILPGFLIHGTLNFITHVMWL